MCNSPFLRAKLHFFHTFLHIPLFQKSNYAIFLKCVKKYDFKIHTFLHIFAHSLISKEWLCDRTFLSLFEKMWMCDCTFQMCDKICNSTIALTKRANVQKSAKNVWILKSHFFCTLKRAIAHFQSVQLPNPDLLFLAEFMLYSNSPIPVVLLYTHSDVLFLHLAIIPCYWKVSK